MTGTDSLPPRVLPLYSIDCFLCYNERFLVSWAHKSIVSLDFWVNSQSPVLHLYLAGYCLWFFQQLRVLGSPLMSLSNLELIFLEDDNKALILFFYMWTPSLPSTVYWCRLSYAVYFDTLLNMR